MTPLKVSDAANTIITQFKAAPSLFMLRPAIAPKNVLDAFAENGGQMVVTLDFTDATPANSTVGNGGKFNGKIIGALLPKVTVGDIQTSALRIPLEDCVRAIDSGNANWVMTCTIAPPNDKGISYPQFALVSAVGTPANTTQAAPIATPATAG